MQRADQLLAREQAHHRAQLARIWPMPFPIAPKKLAPPKDDDQDEDKGERETEDEDDPQEGQP
jgi:hypothetical protein